MRNGNNMKPVHLIKDNTVLILPMRNGNDKYGC